MRSISECEQMHRLWIERADASLSEELAGMLGNSSAIEDAFYQDLEFGTAGLRGIIGAGSNRMNIHTVSRATQGLADYLNEARPVNPLNLDLSAQAPKDRPAPTVAICRDSRHMGEEFVKVAAEVLAANGIQCFIYPRVEPTPALSFAVRELGCSAGINITASHNPAQYNGYKAYGPDGCQITSEAAKSIQDSIESVDIFDGVRRMGFDEALNCGLVNWMEDEVLDSFIDAVAAQSLEDLPGAGETAADGSKAGASSKAGAAEIDDADKTGGSKVGDASKTDASKTSLSLVYTPLNGVGLECMSKILDRIGIEDVSVVSEQAQPNGDFETCPYPNPEFKEALELGLKLCESARPDLLLASDPDADRVGVAVLHDGEYQLISGNEMAVLMLDYICNMRQAKGEDLSNSVVVSTIVSTAMVDALAANYGFELRRTLTGFKYIGEQILMLELADQANRFIFGFEESYGYMTGSHVRDKDAINAGMIICQMARWHKSHGRDLIQALEELYKQYAYYANRTINVSYPGSEGAQRMSDIMASLKTAPPVEIAGKKIASVIDYSAAVEMPRINGSAEEIQLLPSANVIEMNISDGVKVLIRPSGTEPKIKGYLFAKADDAAKAQQMLDVLETATRQILE